MIDYTHCTPETIAAAKAAMERERRELERLTGCTILPDGRIILPDRAGGRVKTSNGSDSRAHR